MSATCMAARTTRRSGAGACADPGKFADLVRQRFDKAAKRLGLAIRLPDLRTDLFRPPPGSESQPSLFD